MNPLPLRRSLPILLLLTSMAPACNGSAPLVCTEAEHCERISISGPTAAAPARPLTPQQQVLARLRADLIAIKPEAPASLAMKQQLARDLIAAAQGPNKPSQIAANKLAEGLSSALSEKLLSGATRDRLLQDVNAVLNPQKIAQSQLTDIAGDIQAIFQNNNLDRKQAVAIASDAKALALEIQKAAAK